MHYHTIVIAGGRTIQGDILIKESALSKAVVRYFKMIPQIFCLVLLISANFVNYFTTFAIITYNNKKSTGYQTLFDKLMSRTLISTSILMLLYSTSIYFQTFPIPLTPFYAKILHYHLLFIFHHTLLWLMVVFVYKYLHIFHAPLVEFESADLIIAKKTHFHLLVVLFVLFGIDQGYLSDVENVIG